MPQDLSKYGVLYSTANPFELMVQIRLWQWIPQHATPLIPISFLSSNSWWGAVWCRQLCWVFDFQLSPFFLQAPPFPCKLYRKRQWRTAFPKKQHIARSSLDLPSSTSSQVALMEVVITVIKCVTNVFFEVTRLRFADLFTDFPGAHKIYINQTGAFYFSQACSKDVFNIFQSQT